MSEIDAVASALYEMMSDDWIAEGEARPRVVVQGPFRTAIGTPSEECPDPVVWASLAAIGLGAIVGANVVGMASEAWYKSWARDSGPERLRRGTLAEMHDAGDATVETGLTIVVADRLGPVWLMGACHTDDRGRRRVERVEHDAGSPSGRMLDEMRRIAELLIEAPAPPMDPGLIARAFELTCVVSGTAGALAAPLRADHGGDA